MADPDQLKQTIGRALGRIPSGVFILTAEFNHEASATLVSWVQQAAFKPPTISIAVGKGRAITPLIASSGKLALSIIGEHDSHLMKKYARGIEAGEDAFAGVNVLRTPAGLPILADALAWLEGKVIQTCDFGGDHDLYLVEVTAGELLREGKSFTHLRGNGFHY